MIQVSPIFSSLVMSRASSYAHSSQRLLKVINFLLAHIPWMNESHDIGRPFKVVIKLSSCFFDCFNLFLEFRNPCEVELVSDFCSFTFFNWFLNFIFWLMFFPSNNFIKASNTSFVVFKDDTCGLGWSLIEYTIILLSLTKFFFWVALASSHYAFLTDQSHFLQGKGRSYTSMLRSCQLPQAYH